MTANTYIKAAMYLLGYLPFAYCVLDVAWEEICLRKNYAWEELRIISCDASPPKMIGIARGLPKKKWLPHSSPAGRGLADSRWLEECQHHVDQVVWIKSTPSFPSGSNTVIAIKDGDGEIINETEGAETIRKNRSIASFIILGIIPTTTILLSRRRINGNTK